MEATVAVNFILSYLYNKLPRRRVDMFGEMLEQLLQTNLEKFWLSQLQRYDNTYNLANISYTYTFFIGIGTNQVDPLIHQVAAACLIDIYEILSYFPENLTLFIEPGKLQYLINPTESNVDIWRSEHRKCELFEYLNEVLLKGSGYESQSQIPEQELISSTEKMSLVPTGVPYSSTFGWQVSSGPQIVHVSAEDCFIQKSSSTPNFTAASFAQTKFGSTKLKSQLKRSSRISTYLAHRRSLAPVVAVTTVESIVKTSQTTASSSPSSLSPFTSSYFESPTIILSQRSISLSPCVRPQRGRSPPYSFNLPPILTAFTCGPENIGAPLFPISSSMQISGPTIEITREDTAPITFAVTSVDEQFSWPKITKQN